MVIGTSTLAQYEIDGALGMYSGVFNNPFMIGGAYRRRWFKTTLTISSRFITPRWTAQPSGKAVFVMVGTGFDEIEALAPVDVMRRAGMEVFTVSMTDNRLVKGATGNLIVADMSVSDLSPDRIDWLIFPGADKSEDAVNLDEKLSELVKAHWEKGGNIAAICAAPSLAAYRN